MVGQYYRKKENGVISGNINPPGGCRGQIPGFWKPIFHKKIEFENGLVCFLRFLKFVVRSSNVVALTFRCGSR